MSNNMSNNMNNNMNNMNNVNKFGIVGDFPGDAELLQEIQWCREAYGSKSSTKPPMARLVSLLGALPLQGRYAVAREYLATSPHRDAIMTELFEYCFQQTEDDEEEEPMQVDNTEGEEDEFVLIANPTSSSTSDTGTAIHRPLNGTKFHIFQVVLLLMSMSGKAGADLSRRYLEATASTKYTAKILIQCVECFSCEEFSNQELYQIYQGLPSSVQDALVKACQRHAKNRQAFLEQVHQDDDDTQPQRYPDLIYWCSSDYLAKYMDSHLVTKQDHEKFVYRQWGSHGDVYLAFFRRKIEAAGNDKLLRGRWWTYFCTRLEYNSMMPRHVQALQNLLLEYPACYIVDGTPHDVKVYLEQQQQGDVEQYDEVKRFRFLSKELFAKLTKQERLQWAQQAVDANDWEVFSKIQHNLVPRYKLPFAKVFEAASVDDLWSLMTGGNKSNPKDNNPFLTYFAHPDLYTSAPTASSEQEAILQSWKELHLRCKPSDLTDSQRLQYKFSNNLNDKSDQVGKWTTWYDSYGKFCTSNRYQDALSTLTEHCMKPDFAINIQLMQKQVQYTQTILTVAMKGLEECQSILSADVALQPVLGLLERIPIHTMLQMEQHQVVLQPLLEQAVKILVETALPLLKRNLQFDPAMESTYVTNGSITAFYNTLSGIVPQWIPHAPSSSCSGQVIKAVSLALLDIHQQASKRKSSEDKTFVVTATAADDQVGVDGVASPHKKRKKIVYYQHRLHKEAADKCVALAKIILSRLSTQPKLSNDQGVVERLWQLVKEPVSNPCDPTRYISSCKSYAPRHILEQEKPTIVEKARTAIKLTVKRSHKWKEELARLAQQLEELDLLGKVLEQEEEKEEIPMNVIHSLLLDHAGFANEKVRQNLKDATFAASGEERAEGLITWLTKACETGSVDLITEAFTFAEGRIKNESGANRRTVFNWLENKFASEIVFPSLTHQGGTGLLESLCSAILSIQRNDLSRLDSIARQSCFPGLPRQIIGQVLSLDPSRPCLEQRRLWMNCAMRLDWELQIASHGNENMALFSWPLENHGHELKSATWISQEALAVLYPPSKPTSHAKLAKLANKADIASIVRKDFDADTTFGPAQCVKLLVEAIEAVWEDNIPVPPLLIEGRFHDDPDIAEAQRLRLERLFRLCGTAWQESDILTSAFDNIFRDIETAPSMHVEQANNFFFAVDAFFETPRMAKACDELFRLAVASDSKENASRLLSRWQAIYMKQGSRVWDDTVVVDDRVKNFVYEHCETGVVDGRVKNIVYEHCEGCEPDAWRLVTSKTKGIQRYCAMARELLGMSSSALYLEDVQKVLFTRRHDVLARYLKSGADCKGVFCPSDSDSIDDALYEAIDSHALLSCHSSVSRWYAKLALEKAGSSRCDLPSRVSAIEKFMSTPSTQHADVLNALQSNLDDAVRESLINRVFSLDSPWHILGHLLSQKAIEKNDQRVTAALLGYVARHVHVDKVVRVVEILLKKPRRKKLSFQLHKGVVRMLFDANTPEAMLLLRKEWDNDLPDGVRNLIIEKCMAGVIAGKTEGWEASVLSGVATSSSFEPEVKFALLAPQWATSNIPLDIPKADGVATDEMLDLFRRKKPTPISVDSVSVAQKLSSIMGELEASSDGTLQFLARMKKLSLMDLFATVPVDDQGALDDMLQYLTSQRLDESSMDHKTQTGMVFVATMFGTGVTRILNNVLPHVSLMSKEEVKMRCEQVDAAIKLKSCVRTQLDMILDLPARKHLQRTAVLNSLQALTQSVSATNHKIRKVLLVDPFSKDLDMVMKDAGLISSALALVPTGRL